MDFNAFVKANYSNNDRIARMSINAPEHNYKISTYHYSADDLALINCAENNLYFALNPMKFIGKTIRRDKQHVAKLKFLYVDLDIYKSEWKDYSQDQILMQLENEYFDIKIPAPSYVVNSGRGMYLLWRIEEHINAQPRWEKVQRYLHSQLVEFGADRAVVTDTARVLRIPGSINAKSHSKVFIMQSYNKKYTLYEIMKEYMQDDINTYKATDKKQYKNYKNSGNKVIFMNTPYTLLTARLNDLEYLLLKFRDKEGGMRENILFLYRYWTLCITDDKAKSLESVIKLNGRLKNPLTEQEVIKATASAEKYYETKSFKIRNEKLIEFLNISDVEMREMRSIISRSEKAARKSLRNRKAYLSSLIAKGENTKAYKIKKRLMALYNLLKLGKSQKEICMELNISRATFYNDKKALGKFTDEELCEATKEYQNEDNQSEEKSDIVLLNPHSLKNSAHVLKEDVVLYANSSEAEPDSVLYDSYISGFLLNSS